MEKQTFTPNERPPLLLSPLNTKTLCLPSKSSDYPKPRRSKQFCFHPALDTNYLELFYGTDKEQAFMSFGIFLKFTANEFFSLRPLVEQNRWEAFRRFAHKLKPNFKVVGLTDISKKMEVFEKMDLKSIDKQQCLRELDLLESKFEKYLPIIIEQKELLNKP